MTTQTPSTLAVWLVARLLSACMGAASAGLGNGFGNGPTMDAAGVNVSGKRGLVSIDSIGPGAPECGRGSTMALKMEHLRFALLPLLAALLAACQRPQAFV